MYVDKFKEEKSLCRIDTFFIRYLSHKYALAAELSIEKRIMMFITASINYRVVAGKPGHWVNLDT